LDLAHILLSGPPYNYPVSTIGLFGLVGLAGALAAQRAGGLHDRGRSRLATSIGWTATVITFLIALLGHANIAVIIIAVVVLDIAIQGINILNQTRMFDHAPEARSRLNTAYVTNNFVGGATGSAVAVIAWSVGGWNAIFAIGIILSAAALIIFARNASRWSLTAQGQA
jgi:predicted MFS family arabinose efflux permease